MNFVLPKFYGRLGNQFFQVSAAIGYAKKYDCEWFVPKHYHHKEIYRWFPKGSTKLFPHSPRKIQVYDRTLSDATWCYEEIPFHPGGLEIRGFFQSLKHFENADDEVKRTFTLDINPIDFVSLHVRRGDYLDKNQQTFCPIDMNYINEAIRHFKELGKTKFMVISDDIKWCKENIHDSDCDIQFSNKTTVYDDLSLMASCEHHIMSNSTLAWFGSFLGFNDNKIVISPSAEAPNWFLHDRMDTKDLLPTNWHQIKYR